MSNYLSVKMYNALKGILTLSQSNRSLLDWMRSCLFGQKYYGLAITTTMLWPLYRSTCVSGHLQLGTGGFCWCKVLLLHALADSNQHIRIREKTLEFSSTVLSTLSLYPDI